MCPKRFILFFLLLSAGMLQAQKFGTKTGTIVFEASVASFEEVKAKHQGASAILNTSNGEFAALALVNGFRFKVALMEEHFNENYMESSSYPKTIVRGFIQDFSPDKLKNNKQEYLLVGTISMHGVEQALAIPVFLQLSGGNTLTMEANFKLRPEDFNIKIPKVVAGKIAEEVQVQATFKLNPQ